MTFSATRQDLERVAEILADVLRVVAERDAATAEATRLRDALSDVEIQRSKVADLYASETRRHNETWLKMEGYRRDLEFASAKLAKAGLLND